MLKRMLMFTVLVAGFFAALGINGCQTVAAGDEGLAVVVKRELSGDPKTMDPHLGSDVDSSAQCGMVYEQLYDYDYFVRPAKVVPKLAAAMPEITEEGKVYTIRLRDDVYFQDNKCFPGGKGRLMNADDVLFSFKRMAAHPETTGFWTVEGYIEGLDAYRSYCQSVLTAIDDPTVRDKRRSELHNREVSGLKKVDNKTIRVRLNKPYGQFVYCMCMHYLAVVPREAVEYYGKDLFRNPVGTGPFVFGYWDFGREIMWQRNPSYRKNEVFPKPEGEIKVGETVIDPKVYDRWVGKQLPLADRIYFRILKESQASWLEFLAGNIDVFAPQSDQFSVAVQNDSLTPEMIAKGITLDKYDRGSVEFIEFNMDDPDIGVAGGDKARAIRRAFSLSFDREEYIKNYLNGRGMPATQLIPTMFPEYSKDYVFADSVYNPERGREILKEAGFEVTKVGNNWVAKDPAKGDAQVGFTMITRGITQTSRDMASFLSNSGAKVGLKVDCLTMEFQEFLERHHLGKSQAYNAGWVIDYPDAQNMMQLLIAPQARDHGLNSARYRSPKYDALYNQFKDLNVDDPKQLAEKQRLIVEAHKVLEEDCPFSVLYFQRIYRLNHHWSLQAIPNDFCYSLFRYAASDAPVRLQKATEWRERPFWPAAILILVLGTASVLFMMRVVRDH